jgi:hypothetical protein
VLYCIYLVHHVWKEIRSRRSGDFCPVPCLVPTQVNPVRRPQTEHWRTYFQKGQRDPVGLSLLRPVKPIYAVENSVR